MTSSPAVRAPTDPLQPEPPAGVISADEGLSPGRVPLSATVSATRSLAVASLVGLIVLGVAWELWLAPLRPGGSWLVLKVLPLLLPLAGLLKNRMYTYRWVSLLVWLYFTEGVVRAFSDVGPGRWLAGLEILLCLVLFVACAAHVRWRLRHRTLTETSA